MSAVDQHRIDCLLDELAIVRAERDEARAAVDDLGVRLDRALHADTADIFAIAEATQ